MSMRSCGRLLGGRGRRSSQSATAGRAVHIARRSCVYSKCQVEAGLHGASDRSTACANAVATEPAQGQVVWFQVPKVTQPAGAFIQLVARDPAVGSTTIDMPVLPPVDEYANLTPTSAAPSPSAR